MSDARTLALFGGDSDRADDRIDGAVAQRLVGNTAKRVEPVGDVLPLSFRRWS